MTQAISDFTEAWRDLCYRVAVGKLALPDDTPLPTPADVAGALYYAHKETLPLATVDGVTFYVHEETIDAHQQLPAWIADAVETYRQRLWALWGVAFQWPAAPGVNDRLNTRNGTEKREEHSRQLPDQEAQPASGKVHDLEAASVTSGGDTTAHLTIVPSGAGFPPYSPVRLPDRLEIGTAVLHMLFIGLLPISPDDDDAAVIDDMIAGFEAVHTIWHSVREQDAGASLKHPLAPLIKGWLLRPREVAPASIATMPYAFTQKDSTSDRQLARYPQPGHFRAGEGRQFVFPGFETDHDTGAYLPEELYRLADREGARRGVVSRAQRAMVYAMLRTPADPVASPTGYWFQVSAQEYIAITHQGNKHLPKPNVWLPSLRATRDLLNTTDIPYVDALGRRRYFTPAVITDYPHDADGNISFVTRIPEGYDSTGVRISKHLWEFTKDAKVFYLLLSAPFVYDQPGITWRPRKGGGISYMKDVEAYPLVTPAMIARMANPFAAGRTRRRLEQEAFGLAEEVAKLTGAFQVAKRKDARILLPPCTAINVDASARKKGFEIVR